MLNVDEFESVFRAADKPRFAYAPPPLGRLLLLADLEGDAQQGGGVTMPASGVCTVGFVEAQYETAVEACL